jgi:hypothetical protein
MRPQTLLDVSSRGTAPRGSVADLTISPYRDSRYKVAGRFSFSINLWVLLEGGPVSEMWAVELRVCPEDGRFQYASVGRGNLGGFILPLDDSQAPFDVHETGVVFIRGYVPLFPHRRTGLLPKGSGLLLHVPEVTSRLEFDATFFAASALTTPKRFAFELRDGVPVAR